MSLKKYDADGLFVKELYVKEINGHNENVVIVMFQKPHCEQHFYRPGGEHSSAFVQNIPDSVRPQVGYELWKKARTMAGLVLRRETPAPKSSTNVVLLQPKRVWESGADRATKVFDK